MMGEPQFGEPQLREHFRQVGLFSQLGEAQLGKVLHIVQTVQHPQGHVLFRTGDPSDRIFVVLAGKVRIGRSLEGLGEEALAVLGPGDYFGELSIIDSGPRSADAVIHEAATLAVVDRNELEDLMLLDRGLGYELLWCIARTLATRLRETNDRVFLFASCSRFG